MRTLDYNERDKMVNCVAKIERRERSFIPKVERYFSLVETTFAIQGILGENELKNTPRKKVLRTKGDGSSAQEAQITDLGDL